MNLGKAANITNAASLWLKEKNPNKFFMYIHYDDAHFPYNPPNKFKMYDTYKSTANITGDNFKSIRNGTIKLNEDDLNHIIASYDGEVKWVDEKIGLLLNAIDTLGYTNNTTVIILADHGEEFMEHNGVAHGHTLYEELIRVPLIMKGPTIPVNTRPEGLVQSIDIAPTVLDILDLQPHNTWEGKSLVPLIYKSEDIHDYVYSEHKGYDAKDFLRVIQSKKWKLIKNYATHQNLLFDLENDPAERTNVENKHPKIVATLESQLSKWLNNEEAKSNASQFIRTIKIDAATKEKLQSLGYAN
jgi:arylsulfatase A-like enzyme